MPRGSLDRWTAVVGALLVAGTLWGAAQRGLTVAPYPSGWRTPVLALEMPAGAAELRAVLDAGPGNRAYWRRLTLGDLLYPILYTSFLILAARRIAAPGARSLVAGAAVLFVAAAAADYVENAAIFRALATPADALTDGHAAAIRTPSLVKWTFLAAGMAASAALAFRQRGLRRGLALPAAAAAAGLAGPLWPLVWEGAAAALALYCAAAWADAVAGVVAARRSGA